LHREDFSSSSRLKRKERKYNFPLYLFLVVKLPFVESEYYIRKNSNQNKKLHIALSIEMSRKYSARGDYGREENKKSKNDMVKRYKNKAKILCYSVSYTEGV